MLDQMGRKIDYMRISITDCCNLRCRYCMPEGNDRHATPLKILSYDEFLSVAKASVELGITHFRVTGGEPLMRQGCAAFLKQLKELPGVESVTLTTNGILLEPVIATFKEIGLDGINISLDTLDEKEYIEITGYDGLWQVLHNVEACLQSGIPTKINCVLSHAHEKSESLSEEAYRNRILSLAALSEEWHIDVRFIEWMPLGTEDWTPGITGEDVISVLLKRWPDLHSVNELRGMGPAHYYTAYGLKGCIGIIDPISHRFCADCNRIRLTSRGLLKPCLGSEGGTDLRQVLHGEPDKLKEVIQKIIYEKPGNHCFSYGIDLNRTAIRQNRMYEIGG